MFLFFAAIGVVVAVGVSDRDTLRPIPRDLLNYSPHVLAAGMILIAGRAIGFAVAGYLQGALSRSTPRVRTQITETARFLITAAAAVLALRQLGIDTTILNILIGAVLFGLAAGSRCSSASVGVSSAGNWRSVDTWDGSCSLGDEVVVGDVEGRAC